VSKPKPRNKHKKTAMVFRAETLDSQPATVSEPTPTVPGGPTLQLNPHKPDTASPSSQGQDKGQCAYVYGWATVAFVIGTLGAGLLAYFLQLSWLYLLAAIALLGTFGCSARLIHLLSLRPDASPFIRFLERIRSAIGYDNLNEPSEKTVPEEQNNVKP
jgi:hypothetical protein